MPARDARTGSARNRATGGKRSRTTPPPAGNARPGSGRPGPGAGRASARRDGTSGSEAPGTSVDELVLGPVPVQARLVGAVLVLAALIGAVGAFPTYLVVGGQELAVATGPGSALVALLVPLVHLAVGIGLVRGGVPKFGLAYAAVAGALAVGELLIELYRGRSSTARPGVEVIAGERVLTSSIEIGPGWVLGVVALALTVLAGLGAAVAWSRTVMEDGGALDPARPGLAGGAVLLGVTAVLCLTLPSADVPDLLRTDPATGLQTVVTREGPQALLERPGLALLGGLLLAGTLLLCAVVAPSLRPRLATVGGFLALAVALLAAGLGGLRDAVSSDDLDWTLPGAGLVLTGAGFAVLTVLAWRLRRA